jgi:hypothetical protein
MRDAVARLRSRLEELAEGYVELVSVDEARRTVQLRLVGGRMC